MTGFKSEAVRDRLTVFSMASAVQISRL